MRESREGQARPSALGDALGDGARPRAPGDEAAIRDIVTQLVNAWNRGSGEGFAAPFSRDADFVAFEGTHLEGREAIAAFHQRLFDTALKGTRLEGEPRFVRFLTPELALMHAAARTVLPGESEPSPSRNSMQLFVVRKVEARWRVDAVLNARELTLERQFMWDELESLSDGQRQQVLDFIARLRA